MIQPRRLKLVDLENWPIQYVSTLNSLGYDMTDMTDSRFSPFSEVHGRTSQVSAQSQVMTSVQLARCPSSASAPSLAPGGEDADAQECI